MLPLFAEWLQLRATPAEAWDVVAQEVQAALKRAPAQQASASAVGGSGTTQATADVLGLVAELIRRQASEAAATQQMSPPSGGAAATGGMAGASKGAPGKA